ncbi:MAG: glycosyltransferase family 9 protein [Flavobacteriaceae bacterium]
MKILVIQQKMIGDVLISTILCQQLKQYFPNSTVHYLINEHTLPVVQGNPHIDKNVLFKKEYREHKKMFHRFLRDIKKEKYDVVLDVYCKLESNLISFFSKAPKRISYHKWYSRFFYTHHFRSIKKEESTVGLAIENRLLLLEALIPAEKIQVNQPKIYLSEQEVVQARLFLDEREISSSKPLFMLAILGSAVNKTYPMSYMAQLIDLITAKSDATLLFNYIPSQQKEAEELYALCSPKAQKNIKFEVFAPSLRQFLGILAHCQALIGNEGGAVNMAKALGIPTFSIFSPWVSRLAWDTFGETNGHWAVHLNDYLPNSFANKPKKVLKKESISLYQDFVPGHFKEKLVGFLESIVVNRL